MVYGDVHGYPLADDVVAHELTHGVTQYTSNLFYYYQSGAINESLSDVFGEFVDQTNGRGNDIPSVRWLMGEDVARLGAIRNMQNPPAFGDPDRMTSAFYYRGADDNGGVHTNSGVNNKAAYPHGRRWNVQWPDHRRPRHYEGRQDLLRSPDASAHVRCRLRRPRERALPGVQQPGRYGGHSRG